MCIILMMILCVCCRKYSCHGVSPSKEAIIYLGIIMIITVPSYWRLPSIIIIIIIKVVLRRSMTSRFEHGRSSSSYGEMVISGKRPPPDGVE